MPAHKYFFLDPDICHISAAQFKEAQTAVDSNQYRDGDIVEAWDHVFRWTSDCAPLSQWEEWRFEGDDVADAALPFIQGPAGDSGGTDLLSRLEFIANSPSAEPAVMKMWQHLHEDIYQKLDTNKEQVARGQAVFYRYAPQILASLLHYSLASGFSSPRISKILNLASYLVPPMNSTPEGDAPRISKESNDRTFQRLMETTQWLVDYMGEGAMEPGGLGWCSTVRVRLLHTTMRARLLAKSRKDFETTGFSRYEEKTEGVPISMEDMVCTLNAFSNCPLMCLAKGGITPTSQECEDWTALWRVIGYYFGIKPSVLITRYANWTKNKAMGCSTIVTMFAGEADPPAPCHFPFEIGLIPPKDRIIKIHPSTTAQDPYITPATLPVLFCLVGRWPVPFSFAQHCVAARHMMGETLSDWLCVPRTTWKDDWMYHVGFKLMNLPGKFARIYRKGWDEKRRKVMRKSVEAAVRFELGNRSSKFRPRAPGAFIPVKEGDEFGGAAHGYAVEAMMSEWITLYGEVFIVFGAVAGAIYWGAGKAKLIVALGKLQLPFY